MEASTEGQRQRPPAGAQRPPRDSGRGGSTSRGRGRAHRGRQRPRDATKEQIADSLGITKAAIYKRFASYGLSVNQLKGEKVGRSKVYGDNIEQLIRAMFQPAAEVETTVDTTAEDLRAKVAELQEVCSGLQVETKAAIAGKEAAEARAERAEAQNDLLLMQDRKSVV